MLTGDLVRARIVDGQVKPGFVDPTSPRLIERAEDIRATFAEHLGRRRGELVEALKLVEGDGVDHKLTRGLVKVTLDRAGFEVAATMVPAEVRARVFRLARERGPLALDRVDGGRPTAVELWATLGAELGVDPEVLASCLYGDHEDQQVLTAVDVPSAEWLLHRYNVALVQAVLIRAEELRIRLRHPTPGRARQLARQVKFHQLLFAMSPEPDGYTLVVDGPGSIFAQTTRYGLALARLFPAVLLQPGGWEVEARVTWNRRRATLRLGVEAGLRSHYRDHGAYDTREAAWFAERFEALQSGWTVSRDAEPLHQGGEAVVVPDFSFRKGDRIAHLEILGFWRKSTVPRRLELLKRHGPGNLVLAVSRRLCGEAEAVELPDAVVPFAEVIPAKEVLARVERIAIPAVDPPAR